MLTAAGVDMTSAEKVTIRFRSAKRSKTILAVEIKSEKYEEDQQQLTVQLNNNDLR